MNNNNIGRVAVRTSSRKRQPTPLSCDVEATLSVGEIAPFFIREMVPNSSISVKTRDLIRLATMVVPTAGRLRLNLRHCFVGFSDLTENFEALLANQPISRAGKTFIPQKVPHCSKGFLSLFNLVGAHVTLYLNTSDGSDLSDAGLYSLAKVIYGDNVNNALVIPWWITSDYQNVSSFADANNGDLYKQSMPTAWQSVWNGYSGPALNIAKLATSGYWPASNPNYQFWIPIENKSFETLFDTVSYNNTPPDYFNFSVNGLKPGQSDAVITFRNKVDTSFATAGVLAARFSSFGKRWFNLLIASGCGIDYADFTNYGDSSLLPLFAYFKAYFDSFGLTLYDKWEQTNVYRMMRWYDDVNLPSFESSIINAANYRNGHASLSADVIPQLLDYWCGFVFDVGTAFYTEEQDFTSAHQQKPAIGYSSSMTTQLGGAEVQSNDPSASVKYSSTISPSDTNTISTSASGIGFVTTVPFSQLDIETLKRMYKVVNRNTLAGQRIAKILEMEGLGDYVNECKSRFIGEFDVYVDVDEVTATSDAFDANGDAKTLLGEQGAKGTGFNMSKAFKTSTKEFGYYIVLASIVPEAGYINCALAQARNITKGRFYNPEFDGLGMELNTKELTLNGQQDFSDPSGAGLSSSSFGFVPQYSRHKVHTNLCLGGFAQRTERDYYRQFMLDKVLDVGERDIKEISSSPASTVYQFVKTSKVSRLPVASPNWRYVGRYPWLENYLRIFADNGDALRNQFIFYQTLSGFVSNFFDYSFRDSDKFVVQNRFEVLLSAPWLKITDAYETKEDGNVGSTDTSIGKS